MKKLAVFLVFILSFQVFSLGIQAQDYELTDEDIREMEKELAETAVDKIKEVSPILVKEEWNPCHFRAADLENIEMVSDMFTKHAEDKIVKRLFSDKKYQELVRGLNNDLVKSLEKTLDVCRDEKKDLYDWNAPMSMDAVENDLKEYAEMLMSLKKFAKMKPANDMIATHMKELQEIILGKMSEYLRTNPFLKKESKFSLKIGFVKGEEMKVDFDLALDSFVKGDVWGTIVDGKSTISSTLAVDANNEENMDASVSCDIFVRMVDGHLYVKIDNLDLDIFTKDMDEYTQRDVDDIMNKIKLIEGKWIDVFGDMSEDGADFPLLMQQSMLQQKDIFLKILGSDILTTYRVEDDIAYGGLNPLACDSFVAFGGRSDCLDMWKNIYTHTDGWGVFEMHEYKDTVGVSIARKSINDDMPEEIANMVGQDFVSRSKDEIKRIAIPFGEYGKFLYQDGNITLDAKIPQTKYDREKDEMKEVFTSVKVRGALNGDKLNMKGSVVGDEFDANFVLDKQGSFDDMQIDMSVDVISDEEDFDFSLDMSIDAQQTVISEVNIVAPDKKDIVDMGILK